MEELTNDKEALYRIIDGLMLPSFDRKFSAQLVLGRNWRTARIARNVRRALVTLVIPTESQLQIIVVFECVK